MPKTTRKNSLAKERAKEKRELERRDVAPELRAFAPRVRRKKGMSRAEAVSHFAHEHADEIEAEKAEKAEKKALAAIRNHETPQTKVDYFRQNGRAMVRITTYRPITRASKHFDDVPF